MKINTDLIKLMITMIIIVLMLFFGFMWYRSSTKLDNVQKQLSNAEAKIITLEKDKEKLIEYNLKKDEQIKLIEEEYQETLNNIPTDACGDVKPSKELLTYLKRNK